MNDGRTAGGRRTGVGPVWALLRAFALALTALAAGAPTRAQDPVQDAWPGVTLGLSYDSRPLPALGVQPFTSSAALTSEADQIESIIARDLGYSDRFRVLDAVPSMLRSDQVDYALWNQLRVTWLVTGRVEGSGSSAVLALELHDVVYREIRNQGRFPIPAAGSPDFRLAAHIASDAVVQWVFGEPGMAASRIALGRSMDDGSQDIWVIDSDGENFRRLTRRLATQVGDPITMSPAWSPDGSRIAYLSFKDLGLPRIYEMNLRTGQERMLPAPRDGVFLTPAYHPNGELLYFAVAGGNENGLYRYNVARDCCFENVTRGSRWEDLSPTFSPDGSLMVFNTSRLGSGTPQIYFMPTDGSLAPALFSPYEYGRPGYYTSPDWSPLGNRVAYHGWVERRGEFQILVAEVDSRGRPEVLVRHTFDGYNEDPSWAPDGRHLVYVGTRGNGVGLYVTDVITGRTRVLVSGLIVKNPDWSSALALP